MDLKALQASLFATDQSSQIVDEKVEVNQRHLIDKILARYSAEFTVFRELIQNANDAEATAVEIDFINPASNNKLEENGSNSSSLPGDCSIISVRNNGRPFLEPDWTRLRRIAEGNPDVDKIGFFGVGFFSLFSICEEPFIESNGDCMAFYWRGDQLFTRRGKSDANSDAKKVSSEDKTVWTTFYMQLRESMPLPNIDEFAKFVAMSMAFTRNVGSIKVTANGSISLVEVTKSLSPERPLNDVMNKFNFTKTSPNSIFKLDTVTLSHVKLNIRKIKTTVSIVKTLWSLISRDSSIQSREYEEFVVFMRYACAAVKVSLPQKYIKEMERTTKKLPPTTTKIHLLFTGYEDYEVTNQMCSQNSVFKELAPFPDQGRIFIGFPTHQTTGASFHLAAHLIPTVERESIDFNDKTLNIWNQELLCMGGLMSRIIYEDEMLRTSGLGESSPNELVVNNAMHIMNVFTFRISSPATLVYKLFSNGFNYCIADVTPSIVSSHGVREAAHVRLPDQDIAKFSQRIAVVPEALMSGASEFIKVLEKSLIIRPISLNDVVSELAERVLSQDEIINLLKWWIRMKNSPEFVLQNPAVVAKFHSSILIPGCGGDFSPVPLRSIVNYAHVKMVPPNVPTSPITLPSAISRHFDDNDLRNVLNLNVVDIIAWTSFVCTLKRLEQDVEFAENVLAVISRGYGQLSEKLRQTLISLLSIKKCIPTVDHSEAVVLVKPGDAYFKNVTLFPDLPIVRVGNKSISEQFLKDLGVRTHVELQLVFDRLNDLKWDVFQLVKYLASVQDQLSNAELEKLRSTPLFLSDVPLASGDSKKEIRYRAMDLYAPTSELRSLEVVRMISWLETKWRSSAPEAKFLTRIGLQTDLSLDEILELCANGTEKQKTAALLYFLENFDRVYAKIYRGGACSHAFVPTTDPNVFAKPSECFYDKSCTVMGYKILREDLIPHAHRLQIMQHPPTNAVINQLKNRLPALENAEPMFVYLGNRVGDFSAKDWKTIMSLPFIPVKTGDKTVWYGPSDVYFKSQDSEYDTVFIYVDFGAGNTFLKACGVKSEPNPVEVCKEVLRDPQRFLETIGVEAYLSVLRQIAVNIGIIVKEAPILISEMKKSPFLVAVTNSVDKINPEAQTKATYQLLPPLDIVIVDDTVLSRTFNPPSAPMESLLESFYAELGSKNFSKLVTIEYSVSGVTQFSDTSPNVNQLQSTIRLRSNLILEEYSIIASQKQQSSKVNSKILLEINVLEADLIKCTRRWKSQTDVRNTSAASDVKPKSFNLVSTLYATKSFDYFDVAQVICNDILGTSKLNDALLVATLLSTPLDHLRDKGFAVEKLITPIAPPPRKASVQRSQQLSSQNPHRDSKSKRESRVDRATVKETQNPDIRIGDMLNSNQVTSNVGSINSAINSIVPPPPPPKTFLDRLFNRSSSQSLVDTSKSGTPSSDRTGIPATPDMVSSALSDAVKATKPSNRQEIKSQKWSIPHFQDQMQCTVHHAQNYVRNGNLATGIPFYVSPGVELSEYEHMLKSLSFQMFTSLIVHLAGVFTVDKSALHIFYPSAEANNTIAFYSGGSLFFNVRYFLLTISPQSSTQEVLNPEQVLTVQEIPEKLYYFWFMVYCHELAHYFESAHNITHERYLSSFAENYIPRLMHMLISKQSYT